MKLKPLFLVICLSLFSVSVFSDESKHEQIIDGLKKLAPDLRIDDIQASPIPGLYQILVGADVLYVSEDGRYVLSGDIYDVQNKKNISELAKSHVRAEALNKIPVEQFIEFAPEKAQHTIYVFTDISCGYCRKLHRDIPELNKLGVAIKYLAYPRAGVNSNGAYELAAVWCADDRKKAMTDAKSGIQITPNECDDPVEEHYGLGQALGVSGTPAIFLESGRAVPGYFPPDELIRIVRK